MLQSEREIIKDEGKSVSQTIHSNVEDYALNQFDLDSINETVDEDGCPVITTYIRNLPDIKNVGLFIRRYICLNYGFDPSGNYYKEDSDNIKEYIKIVFDGKEYNVSDYMGNYDVENDDVSTYVKIFRAINKKYNFKKEVKISPTKFVKMSRIINRNDAFELSFALNLDCSWTEKLLQDVLCMNSYSFRSYKEIIAYYCQKHPAKNSYADYCRLIECYKNEREKMRSNSSRESERYTYCSNKEFEDIHSEKKLMDFLIKNSHEFDLAEQTPYREFIKLIDKVDEYSKKEEELFNLINRKNNEQRVKEPQQEKEIKKPSDKYNVRAISDTLYRGHPKKNEYEIMGYCNKSGGKKPKTTELANDIIEKPLEHIRLGEIIDKKKKVERKDLIYLKYFCFNMGIYSNPNFEGELDSKKNMRKFINECNMLLRKCNMSELNVYNKFDIMLILTFYSSSPLEFFTHIYKISFKGRTGDLKEVSFELSPIEPLNNSNGEK